MPPRSESLSMYALNETTVVEEEDEEVESIIHSGVDESAASSSDRRTTDAVDYPRARRDYRRVS